MFFHQMGTFLGDTNPTWPNELHAHLRGEDWSLARGKTGKDVAKATVFGTTAGIVSFAECWRSQSALGWVTHSTTGCSFMQARPCHTGMKLKDLPDQEVGDHV